LAGNLVAEYESGTTYFPMSDHIGSTRLMTGINQAVVQNLDYYPFGQLNSSDSGVTSHKFTGDERDGETGLDRTKYRQYASSQFRWLTPDPAGLGAVDPTNPQSWNRYAYVLNNPLASTDPLGLMCYPSDFATTAYNNVNCGQIPTCPEGDDCSGDSGGGGDSGTGNTGGGNQGCQLPPLYCSVPQQYSADYNGVPSSTPTLITSAPGNQGLWGSQTGLWGCSGPSGLVNKPTQCGYQFGGELKSIPSSYTSMVNPTLVCVSPILIVCEIVEPLFNSFAQPRIVNGSPAGFSTSFSAFLQSMGITLTDSISLAGAGSISQPVSAASCTQAIQALKTFMKKHPGAPPPPGLLQAINACP